MGLFLLLLLLPTQSEDRLLFSSSSLLTCNDFPWIFIMIPLRRTLLLFGLTFSFSMEGEGERERERESASREEKTKSHKLVACALPLWRQKPLFLFSSVAALAGVINGEDGGRRDVEGKRETMGGSGQQRKRKEKGSHKDSATHTNCSSFSNTVIWALQCIESVRAGEFRTSAVSSKPICFTPSCKQKVPPVLNGDSDEKRTKATPC